MQSGNDAAISIAENMKGSEALFAEAMTQEARRLGLKKSVFKNATGLPHPEHLMTMREIAMLARYIIREYPEYYPMFAQREFQYRRHKFVNRNPLLGVVPGVDGLKTGFSRTSGYSLVASAKQDNRRLIIAISGAETAGGAQGRRQAPPGMGVQELLRGQAVRRRRDGGLCARLGRRAHVHASGRRQRRRQRGAAARAGQSEGHGPHLLQGPPEATAQEGPAGRHPARDDQHRRHQRGAALRCRGRGPGGFHVARA